MAKNKWGEDSADIQIDVKGKPSIPTGPLKVSDVTKKGCLLQWSPPSDNGGHDIEHFEVEKMDMSTEQWLPIKNVKGSSLEVTNLVEGRSYKFLVRAVNKDGDSPDLLTEEATVAKNPFDPPGNVK
jgi:titin